VYSRLRRNIWSGRVRFSSSCGLWIGLPEILYEHHSRPGSTGRNSRNWVRWRSLLTGLSMTTERRHASNGTLRTRSGHGCGRKGRSIHSAKRECGSTWRRRKQEMGISGREVFVPHEHGSDYFGERLALRYDNLTLAVKKILRGYQR